MPGCVVGGAEPRGAGQGGNCSWRALSRERRGLGDLGSQTGEGPTGTMEPTPAPHPAPCV